MNQKASLYVPETPTLFPSMLFGPAIRNRWPPFDGGDVHWYYLARNAVHELVRRLGLAGRKVLMPSYHHGVEVEAVLAAGAKPLFYRVDDRWRVDLVDLRSRITPEVAALYLIHYAGFPGPVLAMKRIAREHGLALIEDCALSLFSSYGDRPLGLFGDAGVFCLYKTLPVPNGGALRFNTLVHDQVAATRSPPASATANLVASSLLKNLEMRAGASGRLLRRIARRAGRGTAAAAGSQRIPVGTMHFDPDLVDLGIAPASRSIAARQSPDRIIIARRNNYLRLNARLRDLISPFREALPPGVCPLFYPVWLERKDGVLDCLRRDGIEAVDFWSTGHPACDPGEFPETASAREHVLEIPCHQDLDCETVDWVAERVRSAIERTGQSRPARRAVHAGT